MSKRNILINRYFCGILYRDDINFDKYMKNIKDNFSEVTWIKHDRDLIDNYDHEEYKKEHYHILFKVGDNARHRSAIAKIIGIADNYLEGCNKDAMLMYFIHANCPEKTQYIVEEVEGFYKDYLKLKMRKDKSSEEKLNYIVDNIQNGTIETYYQLFKHCINNGCLDMLQRFGFIITKMLQNKKEP